MPEGQRLLAINMDETAIRFFVQHRGLCTRRARHGRDPVATQQVSRKDMRACLTHVAFACADAGVQRFLPQIFIGNEHIFAQRVVSAIQPGLPKNIILWRRASAWVNKKTMVDVVHALAAALGEELSARRVMLLLDACRIHMGTVFCALVRREGFWCTTCRRS